MYGLKQYHDKLCCAPGIEIENYISKAYAVYSARGKPEIMPLP